MNYKVVTIIVFTMVFGALVAAGQADPDSIAAHRALVEQFRAEKDSRFIDPATSPLPAAQQPQFDGLNYFPVDYEYKLKATYIPESNPRRERLDLTDGRTDRYVKSGQVVFTLDGVEYTLSVYQSDNMPEFAGNPSQLFIPFKDATGADQTHSNGRYLAITPPQQGGQVTLDLNLAFNPYGAYDSSIPSVLPPPENVLQPPLPTGERKYDDR